MFSTKVEHSIGTPLGFSAEEKEAVHHPVKESTAKIMNFCIPLYISTQKNHWQEIKKEEKNFRDSMAVWAVALRDSSLRYQ